DPVDLPVAEPGMYEGADKPQHNQRSHRQLDQDRIEGQCPLAKIHASLYLSAMDDHALTCQAPILQAGQPTFDCRAFSISGLDQQVPAYTCCPFMHRLQAKTTFGTGC